MQPIFYHDSRSDALAPAHSPVAIHPATAAPLPASPPPAPGTPRSLGNAERNSRLAYRVKTPADQPKWQADLPAHFTPAAVLAGAGHAIVDGPDGWLLVDAAGRVLARDRRGEGEISLDPAHHLFYTPGPTGYVEAHSLLNGRREFFLTAFFGQEYRRALIDRHDGRMLIVSIERPADPHARAESDTSVVEVQELREPFQFSDEGRLKSAKRLDYVMATTTHLLTAVHGDAVALAVDDNIYIADFAAKLQRRLTGQFHPLFLSMDEVPRLYLVTSNLELWVVTLTGEQIVRKPLPNDFTPAAPPIVGLDHMIYLTSRNRVLALDPSGAVRWEASTESPIAGAAITPAGELLVATAAALSAYDRAGKPTRLFAPEGDTLATPPAAAENGDLLVAGHRRLYCLP